MITNERLDVLRVLVGLTKNKLKTDLRDTKYYNLECLLAQITGTKKIAHLSEKQAEALEFLLMIL